MNATQGNAGIGFESILAFGCVAVSVNACRCRRNATQGLASFCEPAFSLCHLHSSQHQNIKPDYYSTIIQSIMSYGINLRPQMNLHITGNPFLMAMVYNMIIIENSNSGAIALSYRSLSKLPLGCPFPFVKFCGPFTKLVYS